MRQRKTAVTVRLDADELAALRQQAGENDADRLRGLIRAAGLADSIVRRVESSIDEIMAGAVRHLSDEIGSADSRAKSHDTVIVNLLRQIAGPSSS